MENFWEGKNVLVTGAMGFIGSWLTEALVLRNAKVTIVERDITPNSYLKLSGAIKKVNIVNGSLASFSLAERAVNEYEAEIVFHLAAQAIVGAANRSPLSTFESNIKGTWNILEACRLSRYVKGVVAASSDKAYGDQEKLPYTEDMPLLGIYPYDASKACADILSRSYFATYNLPVAVTRCANIYGGGDLNFSRIAPDTIQALLQDRQPIIRSDGTPERDYMYIKDAVYAYLILAENIESIKGEAFNFGTNNPISVLDLVNKIISISGKKIEPVIKGTKKPDAEIDRQFLDSTKAKKLLKWEPKFELGRGLKETYGWYEENYQRLQMTMPFLLTFLILCIGI